MEGVITIPFPSLPFLLPFFLLLTPVKPARGSENEFGAL